MLPCLRTGSMMASFEPRQLLRPLASLALATVVCACSDTAPGQRLPASMGDTQPETAMSRPAIDDATRALLSRTGFNLSNDVELLGTDTTAGIDRRISFAVRVPTGQVQTLLGNAGFTTPLKAGNRVFQPPVDGVDTNAAKKVSAAQDTYRIDGTTLTRDVMVIWDDPETAIVHVWAYTT